MWVKPEDRKLFKSIILLDLLDKGRVFKTVMAPEDKILESLFIDLLVTKSIWIDKDRYVITPLGKKGLDTFMDKYFEYLKTFDVFSCIDLKKPEFAFTEYWNFATDEEWDAYKMQPRFEDLRIAVALFRGQNPAEIVFMNFINKNRFDTSSVGWQMDLVSNAIWDEIEAICDTAYKPEQFEPDEMLDMVTQGFTLMVDIVKEEYEREKVAEAERQANAILNSSLPTEEYTVTEVVTEEIIEEEPYYVYYESYLDPFFIPVFWYDPIIIW